MRAPDMRCGWLLVPSAVLRLRPRCERNDHRRLLLFGRAQCSHRPRMVSMPPSAARPCARQVPPIQLARSCLQAAVAQLAEQRTFNPKVVGSIPTGGIRIALEIGRFQTKEAVVAAGTLSQICREASVRSEGWPVLRAFPPDRLPPRRHAAVRSGTRSTGLPDGRQVQKKIGPAWTERGRPAAGYFTKRTAEAWLQDLLRKRDEGRCRAWSRPVLRSLTRRPSGFGSSRRTESASLRRWSTTGRR